MDRSAYRIIDANFNRAREACRLIEEFCRFTLNYSLLTDRTKQLRHKLCSVIDKLDAGLLLANRDIQGDVGAAKQLDSQMVRRSVYDCFTAACKRLTEALRVLSEMLGPLDKAQADALERLRFDAYALEKDIALFADTAEKFGKVHLYVIITSDLPAEIITLASRCIKGGADCIQLRAKKMSDDQLLAVAAEMVRFCRQAGVISIINDRVDIAVASGADGVHLGQNDLSVEQAQKLACSPIITGKSTHSIEQLKQACEQLPAYVGLGPVFSTGTKPNAVPVGLEYVRKAISFLEETAIAHVAIGGITLENVENVLQAGAKAIAVCSAITEAPDVEKACRQLKSKITHFAK